MGLINGSVYLENNYELWKEEFNSEKRRLENIFHNEKFTIEHVGPTSIRGLSAKPIIDIAIGVDDLNSITKYLLSLEGIYTIKPNTEDNEILLIRENKVETFSLIHVLPINSERYINLIKFRDILNANPDIVRQYENLKIELAAKYFNDRKTYTKLKNDFIQDVLKKH